MASEASREPDGTATRVDSLRRKYEIEEAEAVARDGLIQFPDAPGLWIALGRVLMARRQYTDSLKAFVKAAELAPEDDQGLAWQVAALSRLRRFDEAAAVASNALNDFPSSVLIRIAFGRMLLDSSQPGKSIEHLREAVESNPESPHAVCWLVVALGELYEWDEAEALARDLLKRQPRESLAHLMLGDVFLSTHRNAEAVKCFQQTLAIDADNAKAFEGRVTA